MTIWKNAFGSLQKIGKSLMLPVSVLPVAGILLGVGSAHFTWLPAIVSDVMAQSGGAIFGNLPLIFAIGVALGFTANDGVAALAAVVGYVVLLATMGVIAVAPRLRAEDDHGHPLDRDRRLRRHPRSARIAGWLFNRYFRIQLPPYLGFFAGKRSVPILTALAAVVGRRRPQPRLAADRPWHRQLLPLGGVGQSRGGVRDLRRRRAVAHSVRPASHLERAVLLRGRTVPGPGERQDPARRDLPLRRRRSDRREPGRRLPLQDVGTAGCRDRDLAQRQAREPRQGRRHHDLRGAHVVSHRHHRADRVLVPVRRAAAVRDPRAARRRRRTSSVSSSASGTA